MSAFPDFVEEAVLAQRPQFARTLAVYGNLSLADYFAQAPAVYAPVVPQKKEKFLSVFEAYVSELLGASVASRARKVLSERGYVSTADHHGPLTHAFFSNSALMHSYTARARGDDVVIVLACAGVSIDNSSFPRGILMHTAGGEEVRLHLVDRTHAGQPVHTREPYTQAHIDAFLRDATTSALPYSVQQNVRDILVPLYTQALGFASYSAQVTVTNFNLWKHVPGMAASDLIYLDQEELVSRLIRVHHLETTTLVGRVLFTQHARDSFLKKFDGIDGAFTTAQDSGTFLFWYIDGHVRRKMHLTGDALVTDTGVRVQLAPETVAELLAAKKLMPSMALSYLVLAFEYGLSCGGGFCQVNYLSQMKDACLRLLTACNLEDAYAYIESVVTDFFCGEFQLATYADDTVRVPLSPADLICAGDARTSERIVQKAHTLTLHDAVRGMMPELYKITTGIQVGEADAKMYTRACYEESTVHLLRQ